MQKLPKPWLAGVLSLLGLGAGHFYAGTYLRATIIALALIASTIALRAWSYLGPWHFLGAGLTALALSVWLIWDSMRIARDAKPFQRPAQRRWVLWVLFVLVSNLAQEISRIGAMNRHWLKEAQSFSIPSDSMSPTLLKGNHVLADLEAYRDKPIERGDIIVFRHPQNMIMIKRVIGVGGDTIEMRKRALFLNGKPIHVKATGEKPPEFAAQGSEAYEETIGGKTYRVLYSTDALQDHFKTQVPDGMVYVLGDHRDFSNDSRFWGPVSSDEVLGKALFVYFRLNTDSGNWRLSLWPRWIK
jgi:signal peptidase I